MKQTIILFGIFIQLISQTSQAQFNIIDTGFTEHIFDIHCPLPETCYAVGGGNSQSIILKTVNGGVDWNSFTNSNTSWLYGVYFLDENNGYACGHSGVIYHTNDGGINWNLLNTGTTEWIMDIHFLNTNIGYGVGLNGLILKTGDGGATWVQKTSNTNNWLVSVFFINADVGFATGGDGILLKTTNGGEVWNQVPINTSNAIQEIYFSNDSIGYCVGFDGKIFKTLDSGSSWEMLISNTTMQLESVHFKNPSVGYVVGEEMTILKTVNGGETWDFVNSPISNNLNGVFLTDENLLIVADTGMILQTGLVTDIKYPHDSEKVLIFPNPTNNFIHLTTKIHFKKMRIEVFNILGETVLSKEFLNNDNLKINLHNLEQGNYFLKIIIDQKIIDSNLILKI